MTLPPLPEPDTHCFDDDTGLDVWSHSPDQMRAYAEQAVAAERERCAAIVAQGGAYRSPSQEFGDLAFPEEAIRTGLTP